MISFRLIRGFLRKEFLQALRDKRMRVLLFIAPALQLVLFGVALSTDVKNIRLWVAPIPGDSILQHIYQHSIESKWFLPAKTQQKLDPIELLKAGKIDAALLPRGGGLTEDIGRGTGDLQLLIDATNVIQAQTVENYIKGISNKVLEQDLKLDPIEFPIHFVERVLYNPSLETSFFMIPGVMCLLLTVTTVILTCMSITREKEMGTFEMLISAPTQVAEIILGKTIPFVILGFLNAVLIFIVAVIAFQVPMRGSILVLALSALVFICTTVAIGTLISTISNNQQQATLGSFLFLFPAILLSGLLFPIENMPEALKWLSYIDPLSHYLALLRNIMLKGGGDIFIIERIGILLIMGVIIILASYKRFHTTLE